MATESVKFDIKVFDNFIEIIPKDGIKDNSIYEIKLKGIKPTNDGIYTGEESVKIITAMNPMYCSIMDVSSLLDVVDIPEDIVLYNIREASKYASYIYETTFISRKININKIPYGRLMFTDYDIVGNIKQLERLLIDFHSAIKGKYPLIATSLKKIWIYMMMTQ